MEQDATPAPDEWATRRARRQAILEHAERELEASDHPDRVLALLLEYEMALEGYPEELLVLVAGKARALDARVLSVVCQSMRGRQAAAHNPYLGPVNADWLALETIASMVPPYTMVERMGQQMKRQVLRELIQRYGLGARSLAGRLLHREAWSNTNQSCQLGRIALACYLDFPDVPAGCLESLKYYWRDDRWGREILSRYRPRANGT